MEAMTEAQVAQWAALRRLRWREGRALTAHVQDLALAAGKRALVATSGGSYKKFVCASSAPCSWLVNAVCARARDADGRRQWYVTSGSLVHSQGCTSAAKPTARQLQRSSLLQAAVLGDAKVSSAQLVQQLQEHANLECSKSMVYKAKTDLLDALHDQRAEPVSSLSSLSHPLAVPSVVQSVHRLPAFLRQMQELNTHVASALERDQDGRMLRAVLAMDPTSAWHAQAALALDAIETSHPLFSGAQLLMLIGRDGNVDPVVHAAALVPTATCEHFGWFVDKLLAHGFPLRRFPVFVTAKWLADDPAFVMAKLPHVMVSTRSVVDDIIAASHGINIAPEDEPIVWQAQRAESESEFLAALTQLGQRNFAAAHCLKTALDARRWALFPHVTARKLYGWQSTQLESVDFSDRGHLQSSNTSAAAKGKDSSTSTLMAPHPSSHLPYECFRSLAVFLMSQSFARHEKAVQWTREQRVVTPRAERLMHEQLARAGEYNVVLSTPQLAFVWNSQAAQVRQRRVDLQHRTCTCALRLQLGIPCRHTLAALQKLEQHAMLAPRPLEFFDECYLVSNYASAFQNRYIELPLDENVTCDESLLPPRLSSSVNVGSTVRSSHSSSSSGQAAAPRRKRRSRTKPEHARKRGLYKCHKCHRAEGHNRGTCPYNSNTIPVGESRIVSSSS